MILLAWFEKQMSFHFFASSLPVLYDDEHPLAVNMKMHMIDLLATYLQSPLFETNCLRFYLYGLMGSVIGHEFMHWDDFGRIRVNGSFTLVENMAEGIAASFQAYMKSIEKYGRDLPLHRLNYTSEQLFFISYAQFYCIRQPHFNSADTHAPHKVRVLGVASNSLEFSKAFNCPIGSAMNPEKKCNVCPTSFSANYNILIIILTLVVSL